jgi:hypothetical protein
VGFGADAPGRTASRFKGLPDVHHGDDRALAAAQQDRASLEQILPTMTMPCCLYTGGADGTVQQSERCAKEIPKASFMLFPCFDHAETFRRSDVVLPPVLEFLETHTERVGL